MKNFRTAVTIAVLFLSMIFPVRAGSIVMRADDGADFIRLFNMPCANDIVLAKTLPQFRKYMQAGEANIGGKMYGMCWVALPDGTVGLMYEDGDQGRMPAQAFRQEIGA